jgi:DNA-binding transcriptional regulator YiaG
MPAGTYSVRLMSVSTLETAVERIPDHATVVVPALAPVSAPVPAFSPAKLRAARLQRNLTVRQLAAIAGRDVRTVRRYQAGEVLPPLAVVCAFSAALAVPIGDLFE